jgi:hypothetical protein
VVCMLPSPDPWSGIGDQASWFEALRSLVSMQH